jgi:hypothetical protein
VVALAFPFFTEEDPNARVKGSRDPLGIQPVWTTFGRHVVGNLTSQSTSVRGFTILLLARWLTERLIERNDVSREQALPIFQRMEQVGAYVRCAAHGVEGEIRGIERVRSNLEEYGGEPYIGTEARSLILADQKVYGLWGLYSVPARRSGLLLEGPVGLTRIARDFVEEHYAPVLGSATRNLEALICEGGRLRTKGKGDAIFRTLKEILQPGFRPEERAFYGRHLRDFEVDDGSEAAHHQARLRALLQASKRLDKPLDRDEITSLLGEARGEEDSFAQRLERIVTLESFLAPAGRLFDLALARGGARLDSVAKEIGGIWGARVPHLDRGDFAGLREEIGQASSNAILAQMVDCQKALAAGQWSRAIVAMLEWNRLVMEARGSGPWVRLEPDETLDVRYREAETRFPTADEVAQLWKNDYFIDSLKAVTQQLGRRAS